MKNEHADFVCRSTCINCDSDDLASLSSGMFSEDPVNGYIENDPWGESPLPYIQNQIWEFVQCNRCGQKYHKYILSPEWIQICYSDWVTHQAIQAFEKTHEKPDKELDKGKANALHFLRIEKFTRYSRSENKLRILDYGCGYGDFLTMCDSFGAETIGVDFSPARRSHGRSTIFPNLGDLIQANGDDQKFHAITLFEVLEHLDSPLELLQELYPLLETGGVLILTTPDCSRVTQIDSPKTYRLINPLSHINGFTHDTLTNIAINAGFKPIQPITAHVTADLLKVVKVEVKRVVKRLLPKSTQVYFTR